jgi:hypothetical protein
MIGVHDLHVHRQLLLLMEQIMDREELLRHELLALKEIRLNGASIDRITMRQLRDMEMITEFHDGRLRLTNRGRKMLVRGSPSLWGVAS